MTRLPIYKGVSLAYSYRSGDQRTVYLGTTRSNKLLRIYDKLLQYQKRGVIVKPLPEVFAESGDIDVTSWYRIELQTRRVVCHDLLFGCEHDLSRVLGYIFEKYRVKDLNGYCLDFILELFDWDKLPPIVSNKNFI